MKKFIFSVITVIIALIILALIAEAGFRVKDLFDKNRGLKNSMGDINRKYCHGLKPNTRFRLIASKKDEYNVAVRVNNFGFRGKDITKDKAPGITRIMVMGDSFTFGVGAEENETIPFLIEKHLTDEGEKVEIINAGFGHYSPLLHYLKTRNEYPEFSPDIVLYFFDFSDLADDWKFEQNLVYDKSGNVIRSDPAFVNGKRDWWITARLYSKLCVYINNKVVRLIDKIRILGLKNYIKAKMEGKRAKSLIVQKKTEEMARNPIKYDSYLMIRGRDKVPVIKEHFKRTEKYLDLIRKELAGKGISMILVVYPYGIHVGPDHWNEGRGYWGFERGRTYDDYYAFDMLKDYAKKASIPYINVLPALLKNKDKELYFDLDGHFTPEANRIVAEDIVKNKAFREAVSDER